MTSSRDEAVIAASVQDGQTTADGTILSSIERCFCLVAVRQIATHPHFSSLSSTKTKGKQKSFADKHLGQPFHQVKHDRTIVNGRSRRHFPSQHSRCFGDLTKKTLHGSGGLDEFPRQARMAVVINK